MTLDAAATLRARKAELRRTMRARRRELPESVRASASRKAARHVLANLPWQEGTRVSLFWPLEAELDTRPLLHALHWMGAVPLLPRMNGKQMPLSFHPWTPDLALVEGPFDVREPPPGSPAVIPDIVLAPLLAFDAHGHRLGYGAGFYDRTFTAIRAQGGEPLRAGLCFACQEVEAVPVDEFDIPLDLIVTEEGVRRLAAR